MIVFCWHMLVICSWIQFVLAQSKLIIPVYSSTKNVKGTCEHILQSLQNKSDGGQSVKVLDGPGVVSAYIPQCRLDRPDLFNARQCSQHDCFCVNVTTGTIIVGTRSSPSEVGDCSTAIYSVIIAIPLPGPQVSVFTKPSSYNPTFMDGYTYLLPERDKFVRNQIRISLEKMLRSVVGFQRVVNVTRLFIPSLNQSLRISPFVCYKVELSSTGHVTLNDPQDLIKHRLHEGYLPDLGSVDPELSSVELIHSKLPDPPRQLKTTHLDYQLDLAHFPIPSNTLDGNNEESNVGKVTAIRSSDTFDNSTNNSSPDKLFQPKNEPMIVGGLGNNDENLNSARQGSIQSRSVHLSWPTSPARSQILSQPGVIAGIVGSVILFLLLLILLILFCIYRLRKKDEGSYALEEPKKLAAVNAFTRAPTREFYA